MPPRLQSFLPPSLLSPREQPNFAAAQSQWQNPNDILSILMIIGGDIVQRALAQLAGASSTFSPSTVAPVAFSFGWVAYAFSAILSAVGDGRLMPAPDCNAILVNARSGYVRNVQSWALGRLVRDHRVPAYEGCHSGLTLAFYRTSRTPRTGAPARDWVYWSGVLAILAQLGIAAIPGALRGNWMVLVVTAGGTLLALAGGALPQWRHEKWAARRVAPGRREVVCLTGGNGSRDVLVVVSDAHGLRLEDLACARPAPRDRAMICAAFVLVALWIVQLITVESLESDAWFSLAVGALGMVQNAVAAGATRSKAALGFHFEDERIVHDDKVFRALVRAEALEPHVGMCLLPVFFPGGLRDREEDWRLQTLARYAEEKALDGHPESALDAKSLTGSALPHPGAQTQREEAARQAAKRAGYPEDEPDAKMPEAAEGDSVLSLGYDTEPQDAAPTTEAVRRPSGGLSAVEQSWRRARLAQYAGQTLVEGAPMATTGVGKGLSSEDKDADSAGQ